MIVDMFTSCEELNSANPNNSLTLTSSTKGVKVSIIETDFSVIQYLIFSLLGDSDHTTFLGCDKYIYVSLFAVAVNAITLTFSSHLT